MPMHSLERRLADAQGMTTIVIAGARHARIVYGKERAPWVTAVPCHDCGARAGMLHIPGCDVEECPRCHGLLNLCNCAIRDEEEDEPSADRGATTAPHDDEHGSRGTAPRAHDGRDPISAHGDCPEPSAQDDRGAPRCAYGGGHGERRPDAAGARARAGPR